MLCKALERLFSACICVELLNFFITVSQQHFLIQFFLHKYINTWGISIGQGGIYFLLRFGAILLIWRLLEFTTFNLKEAVCTS